jgi:hypothetical protein
MSAESAPPSRLKVRKVKFSQTEDSQLADLVSRYGDRDWTSIANAMGNRTVRQCRERWTHYLNPSVTNGPWSIKDEDLLLEKFRLCGPRWKRLTEFFPGRTDINIKNHYMTMVRRQSVRRAEQSPRQPAREPRPEPDPDELPLCFCLDRLFQRCPLEWDFVTHNLEDFTSRTSQLTWYWEYGFPVESLH